MKEIIVSSLGVLLLIYILLFMLDIRNSSTVNNTYRQRHKAFVPDTMPMKLSPDSIKRINNYSNDQVWN